jgi:cytochrome P450 family 135
MAAESAPFFGARRGLPPGPRMPPALQAVGWALRPLPLLRRSAERYGELFTLRVRRESPWVVVTDPEAVRLIFTADPDTQRPAAVEASPTLEPLLGRRSVMLLDEPEHMLHRKLMLPSFHGERMNAYDEMIVEVARREISTWESGERLALWPRMQRISSEVLIRSAFGTIESEPLKRLRELLRALTSWLNDPRRLALVTTVGPRWLARSAGFRAHMGPLEQAVLEEVRRRRAEPSEEHDDILAMLERAHAERGAPLDDRQLRDELVTLISDGPTSTSLAWAFERLLRHPDKLARLRDEVLEGRDEAYVEAIVKETLRLCPVVPLIMRKLLAPIAIGPYTIPAGTTVAPSPYLIHRREDVYPRPRAFLPERFLGTSAPAYAWIPFGGGVRRCLAAGFAQLTIKRVLQTVLDEVELRAANPAASEGARRSSVAFVPDEQALAIVTRRAPLSAARPPRAA